jgi:hypothetical protein
MSTQGLCWNCTFLSLWGFRQKGARGNPVRKAGEGSRRKCAGTQPFKQEGHKPWRPSASHLSPGSKTNRRPEKGWQLTETGHYIYFCPSKFVSWGVNMGEPRTHRQCSWLAKHGTVRSPWGLASGLSVDEAGNCVCSMRMGLGRGPTPWNRHSCPPVIWRDIQQ